jgi:hypothetical protein
MRFDDVYVPDLAGLAAYADECCRREHDDPFLQPGRERGWPW